MTHLFKSKKHNSSTISLLGLSAFWQSQLKVVCQTAEFCSGGQLLSTVTSPSCLITIEPYAPGGLRRFCINVNSPLIQQMANLLVAGHEDIVFQMGEILVSSASWPLPFVDGTPQNMNWDMPRGLIARPHDLNVWPVPHQEVNVYHHHHSNTLPSPHLSLSTWPKRICHLNYEYNVVNPEQKGELVITYVNERWERRDAALELELEYLLQVQKSRHRSSSARRLFQQCDTALDQEVVEESLSSSSLLTFSPSLPIYCVAQALLQSPHHVPRHLVNGEASWFLLEHDRLFALSLFFNVPLIDRTRTLQGALRTAPYVKPTPTRDQVQQFEERVRKNGEKTAHAVLRALMLQRARELWNMTETKNRLGKIYVAWSGGIDSTSVICALLETAKESKDLNRRQRLCVVMDDKSIGENPLFHQDIIEKLSIAKVDRDDKPLSWHEAKIRRMHPANIFVTGELADQLFGSDKCGTAFPDAYGGRLADDLPEDIAINAPWRASDEHAGIFADLGLSAPWQETILPYLDSVGLLAKGDKAAWKKWIAPQLAKSPVSITSTYDFLWWMNFSMKWQNVSLRCLHDGGEPLLEQAENIHEIRGCIHHFFDDQDLQCWSCVQEFHKCKFPDLTDWKTYKEPLKNYIRTVDDNEDYYCNKIKVGSLGFGAPEKPNSYVHRFHGALAQIDKGPEAAVSSTMKGDGPIAWEKKPSLLSWGTSGLLVPRSEYLPNLLNQEFRMSISNYPNDISKTVFVDPWGVETSGPTSPFGIAPFFADDDERQRRVFNPVTAATLTGKCSALMNPELLYGRTFLDLGACLGASTHWALCMGATHGTAVEIQKTFCLRAHEMLKQAEELNCWPYPAVANGQPRFNVVQRGVREYLSGCADRSHDVVLAAGLLHCFVDPTQILVDICRVASHAVLIEMVHPAAYRDGYLDDPDEPGNNSFRSSVRPFPRRMEQGGLIQIAPAALVNMADNDASYRGLATLPSRLAIESMMKNLGFRVSRIIITEHPTRNEDVVTYTKPRVFAALSNRYFLRCVRIDGTNEEPRSIPLLEAAISQQDKSHMVGWKTKKSWYEIPGGAPDERSKSSKSVEQIVVNDDPSKQWEFDATVANRFEREARCHIPDYFEVVDDSIGFLEDEIQSNPSKQRKEACNVVDIGCATGNTLLQLVDRGFGNVHGVDIASAMLDVARDKIRFAESDKSVSLHLSQDPLDLPPSLGNELDAAFVNWTLHFVPEKENRKSFLRNIASRMSDGALLVLTEKTTQDALTKDAYYRFKKRNGVSEKEIAVKEKKLKGVLITFPVEWYLEALPECGFTDVVIHRARYGFVTFVARRKRLDDDLGAISKNVPIKTASEGKFVTWENLSESAGSVFYKTQEKTAPFVMKAWGESTDMSWSGGFETGTVYGYVYGGPTEIQMENNMSFTLHKDMYFACPGRITIQGGCGCICIVEGHRALFSMGGPVEDGEGRLPYIDGCTDTLLLSPIKKGAPCLNHLHFPSGIKQTRHTHPSGRAGIVIRGKGTCIFDKSGGMEGEKPEYQNLSLEAGMAFVIPTNLLHAFETAENEELDVIAFHPDSDFGPSSTDHPMINRTIVEGVAASRIKAIQTQALKPIV